MRNTILLVLSLFLASTTWGQRCLSEVTLASKMAESAEVRDRRAIIEAAYIQSSENIGFREVVTLNVVVHVVYYNAEENISDTQIQSQIDVLNEDFRLQNANASIVTWPQFANKMADLEIEFRLADTDPWGQPTTGITRTQTNIQNIASQQPINGQRPICYTELGGQDAWCPDHYINIWVGNFLPGTAGETSFPGEDEPSEDGIRIDPYRFGRMGTAEAPYNLGRTLTHEMGHFFDLRHIWGDLNGCAVDDGISDTPLQENPYMGCPTGWNYISCSERDMYVNYMDYTDDACMAMFTAGQKERVQATLNGPRAGLLMPMQCIETGTEETQWFTGAVFPNPTKGKVFLDLPFGNENVYDVELFDVTGKPVSGQFTFTAGMHDFDVSHLDNGIYFIKITQGENFTIVKLIVIA